MKAKVIRDHYRMANLQIGEVVEIIHGMETDAESIWNAPAGKLVLCKKEDGTFTYGSMLDMEIVEYDTVDWSSFRREAAKDILAGMLSAAARINIGGKQLQTFVDFTEAAIKLADCLITKLKEK